MRSAQRRYWLVAVLILLTAFSLWQSRPAAAAPINDNFANASVIMGASGTTNGSNVGATAENGEPNIHGASPGNSVWYRWTAPATGGYAFTATGSNFNPLLDVYTGSAVNNLQFDHEFRIGDFTTTDEVISHLTVGTTYSILVEDDGGGPGTFTLTWMPVGAANDDFVNVQTINGASGSTQGSDVLATYESGEPNVHGASPGNSVWYRWTAPATGGYAFTATGSNFNPLLDVYTGSAVNNLQFDHEFRIGDFTTTDEVISHLTVGTTYSILVEDDGGGPGAFTLTWMPVGPVNDDFTNATALIGSTVYTTGSNAGATYENGEPRPRSSQGYSAWYLWVAPATGTAAFSSVSSQFDPILAAYTGVAVNGLTDMTSTPSGDGTAHDTITFSAVAGTTYHIRVDSQNSASGTFTLYGGLAPANDNFANAQVLSGPSGTVSENNLLATNEPGEPGPANEQAYVSVWYQWTATGSGTMTINTDGSDFDTVLAAYTGSTLTNLAPVASNDNYSGDVNGSSKVTFGVTAGTTYDIDVDGFGGLTGEVVLNWSATGSQPAVTTTTLSSSANPIQSGQALTLTATVTATSGTPTGSVSFADSGTSLGTASLNGSGAAQISVSSLSVGTHSIAAAYTPTGNFAASNSSTLSQVVTSASSGANWAAAAIATDPSDTNTRILWDDVNGTAAVWTVDPGGNVTAASYFGPYGGWTATTISAGPDGNTRLLWENVSGSIAIWTVTPSGGISAAAYYGPYGGWTAVSMSTGPDNNTHILWRNTDGSVDLWTVDTNGTVTAAYFFGPFGGWTAAAISTGADNQTRLLWQNVSGSIALWTVDTNGNIAAASYFGPYGGWTATSISTGPDNNTALVWQNVSQSIAVWTVTPSGGIASAYYYGPYSGWSASQVAVRGDLSDAVLWNNVDGEADLWAIAAGGVSGFPFGPYN